MYAFNLKNSIAYKYVEQARRKIKDLDGPETPEMSVLHRILKRDPHTKRAVIMGMDLVMAGVDTVKFKNLRSKTVCIYKFISLI